MIDIDEKKIKYDYLKESELTTKEQLPSQPKAQFTLTD